MTAPPKAKKQRTKAPAEVPDDEVESDDGAAVPDDEEEESDEDAEEEDPKDTAKTSGPASTAKSGKKRTPKEADLDEVEEEIAISEKGR